MTRTGRARPGTGPALPGTGRSRRAWLALALLAGLAGLGGLALALTGRRQGLPAGGAFTLASAQGPVTLDQFRGRAVLVFFGYLACPDVCPAALAGHAEAIQALPPGLRDRVAVLFVSVDPGRDAPAAVQAYAGAFGPQFRGATGTPAQVAAMARAYGAFFAAGKAGPDGQYPVDHSPDTFLVGPDGQVAARFPMDTPPASMAAELRRLLASV